MVCACCVHVAGQGRPFVFVHGGPGAKVTDVPVSTTTLAATTHQVSYQTPRLPVGVYISRREH